MKLVLAEFLLGVTDYNLLPKPYGFEVAILGRSNVGKSTLINRLTKQRKLAKTSAQPGKTKEINCYKLNFSKQLITLVDFPGFGYAKFSHSKREEVAKSIVDYITYRQTLSLILLLNDIRRAPQQDELAIIKLANKYDIPICIMLTKADKVSNNQRKFIAGERAKEYGLASSMLVLTGNNYDTEEIWPHIFKFFL